MDSALPIPTSQLHYADPAVNDEAQLSPLTPFIDRLHYPTLGCPALLTRDRPLAVLVSLPEAEDPKGVSLTLVDRHGATGSYALPVALEPEPLGPGPLGKTGRRMLWRLHADVSKHEPRLYDLILRSAGGAETQPNAVRIYPEITGREKIILCGDSQFNIDNEVCIDRWIARVNAVADAAWIALVGDVCDNGVMGVWNVVKLAAGAKPGPVRDYYPHEFSGAREKLAALKKPVVLVPGNHDGMTAYRDYGVGADSDAYLGPDVPGNEVAYDGHHYFRRTFGPLYFHLDWDKTRYLCANSFELDRRRRLGFHAVVNNWGGWMRPEQLAWIAEQLADASARGMHKVALMHHDPRGGSLGKRLGYYSEDRPFSYQGLSHALPSYIRYCLGHVTTFQQEWMKHRGKPMADHPARTLLGLLLENGVWAVVMGHDNECWVESYSEGQDIFRVKPRVVSYPAKGDAPPDAVLEAVSRLKSGEVEALDALLERRSREEATAILDAAIERLEAAKHFRPQIAFAPGEVEAWNLAAKAPIHFAHVDDVGAYDHAKDSHFEAYGYVLAQLDEGRPVALQRFDVRSDKPGPVTPLPVV